MRRSFISGIIPKDVELSERRQNNIQETFWWIKWNFKKARCIYWGLGDYPQFRVPGKFQGLDVIFETAKPTGNSTSSGLIVPAANLRIKCLFKNAEDVYREWFV